MRGDVDLDFYEDDYGRRVRVACLAAEDAGIVPDDLTTHAYVLIYDTVNEKWLLTLCKDPRQSGALGGVPGGERQTGVDGRWAETAAAAALRCAREQLDLALATVSENDLTFVGCNVVCEADDAAMRTFAAFYFFTLTSLQRVPYTWQPDTRGNFTPTDMVTRGCVHTSTPDMNRHPQIQKHAPLFRTAKLLLYTSRK